MAQPRIVTIEELQREIRGCGVSKLARLTGFSRKHISRIVCGKRNPGKRFLAAMKYRPVICYVDVMKPQDTLKPPSQAAEPQNSQ